MSDAAKSAAEDAEFPFEDKYWKIVIPKSYEASVYWGDGTEWCTAYKDSRKYYDEYSSEGKLYIIISNLDGTKCQFHFESGSFMNQYDEPIEKPILNQFGYNEGLIEYFKRERGEKGVLDMSYDNIGVDAGVDVYRKKIPFEGIVLIDSTGKEISPLLSYIEDFNEYGLAKCRMVKSEGNKSNVITIQGDFVFENGVSYVENVNDDYITYCPKAGSNFEGVVRYNIENGTLEEILEPKYSEVRHYTSNKVFYVKDANGFANLVDKATRKECIANSQFSFIKPTTNEKLFPAIIKDNNKYCVIDRTGKIYTKDLYDELIETYVAVGNISYIVKKDKKYNALDYNFNEVYPEWLDNLKSWKWNPVANTKNLYYQQTKLNGKDVTVYSDGRIVENTTNENVTTIKNLITEIKVVDAYQQYYKDIPEDEFESIIVFLQPDNDILLPETKWALGLRKKNSPRFMEDLYKLHNENGDGYLDIFKRAKERRMIGGQQADLNRYKSIAELGRFVSQLDMESIMGKTKGEISNAVNNAKDNAEFPYEDGSWKVIIPKSYEASCYWGNGTEWCTAYRGDDQWYNHYTEQGPLFINIHKTTGQKYQFHFESSSFMDEYDESLEIPIFSQLPNFGGLMNFYKRYVGLEKFMKAEHECICDVEGKYRFIEKTNGEGEFIINDKGERIAGPFGYIQPYTEKSESYAAQVRDMKNEEWMYVDINGNNLLPCYFRRVYMYNTELFAVSNQPDKWFIYYKGELINKEQPFTTVFQTYSDTAYIPVCIDRKRNLFNVETLEFVLDEWVDFCLQMNKINLVLIRNNGKMYVTNLNGERISDYYNSLEPNYSVFFDDLPILVCDGPELNYLNKDGKLIFSKWLWNEIIPQNLIKNIIDNKKLYQCSYVNKEDDSRVYRCYVTLDGWIYDLKGTPRYSPAYQQNDTKQEPDMTLEEVKYIVHEAAKHLLQEITVKDAQSTYYTDIPEEHFEAIVQASQGDNNILLPTTKWLLALYKRNDANKKGIMEYLPKLRTPNKRGYLDIWDRAVAIREFEGRDADLNTYRSIYDWVMNMETLDSDKLFQRTKGEWSKAVNKAKDDIKHLYEDEKWLVIQPLSMDASCYWGNNTSWCTASRNEKGNYFNSYNEVGPLYININKYTGEKYQFSIVKREFRDAEDESIETPVLDTIGATKGLIEFYKKTVGTNDWETMFDLFFNDLTEDDYTWNDINECGYAAIKRENPETGEFEMNIYSSYGLISYKWFKWVENPDSELTFVRVREQDDTYAILDLSSGNIMTEFYDFIDSFMPWGDYDEGIYYSVAREGNKKGLITWCSENARNIFEPDTFYDYISYPDEETYNLFKVKNGKKEGYININGQIIGGLFDKVHDFEDDVFLAIENGQYNYFDYEGEPQDEWKPIE